MQQPLNVLHRRNILKLKLQLLHCKRDGLSNLLKLVAVYLQAIKNLHALKIIIPET